MPDLPEPDGPAEPDKVDKVGESAEPDKVDKVGESAEPDEAGPVDEPAWRARLRRSGFGQIAVVLVTSFAIAITAWWVVRPSATEEPRAETAVVPLVDIAGDQRAPVAGDAAPAFEGADIKGGPVSLAQMRGKPVWLMFVATWCTGCRTEMPDVKDAVAAYGDDIQLVVVYTGESVSTVRSYADRVGNDFTQVADESQAISASYGVMGVPSHVFIDADGVVHQVQVGLLSSDQMARAIEEVKAG